MRKQLSNSLGDYKTLSGLRDTLRNEAREARALARLAIQESTTRRTYQCSRAAVRRLMGFW